MYALRASLDLQDEVVFTGRIEYEDLPEYLRLADVAINPFEHSLTTDCALPHKVLQYLAVGLPTISTDLAGLVGVLGHDSGSHFEISPSIVAQRALEVLDQDGLRKLGERARAYALARFSAEAATDSMESTILDAVRRGNSRYGS